MKTRFIDHIIDHISIIILRLKMRYIVYNFTICRIYKYSPCSNTHIPFCDDLSSNYTILYLPDGHWLWC